MQMFLYKNSSRTGGRDVKPKAYRPRYLINQDRVTTTIYVDAKKVASEVSKQIFQDNKRAQLMRLGN